MDLTMLGSFAGGIGLFLLGMQLMTDGLKLAAGDALRHILGQWTRSTPRAFLSGALITSLVQSSSAVTVATIGFVNAGILNLGQTIGVIFGSNVGTTMTGWLVALVGFKIEVKALALPLIGVGMLLDLTGGDSRRAPLGQALTGFGLFFLGIDILKNAFAGLGETVPLGQLAGDGVLSMMLFTGIGFLLTFLMQSSSAAMAVTLTAAAGGLIPLTNAAAVVIGANVGTTSTAALAVIGATANAQRVAAAHVIFNLITGLVAFLLLPSVLALLAHSEQWLGVAQNEVTTLAIFHTLFNIFGVLLLWPFIPRLVRFLEGRFRRVHEDLGRPLYLDKNVVTTPSLALDALALELHRIGELARSMALAALSTESGPGRQMTVSKDAIDALVAAVGQFSAQMQRADLPADIGEALPDALRVARYYTTVAEEAAALARNQRGLADVDDEAVASAMAHFRSDSARLLGDADPMSRDYLPQHCQEQLNALQGRYQEIKHRLLKAGADDRMPVRQMVGQLDQQSMIRRLLDQAVKGAQYHAVLLELAARYRPTGEVESPPAEPQEPAA